MNYYEEKKRATAVIKGLLAKKISPKDIEKIILERFGYGKRFVKDVIALYSENGGVSE